MSYFKSKIKYYSAFIIPIIICLVLKYIPYLNNIVCGVPDDKINTLMGCITGLIGFMLAILTIYVSLPNNDLTRRMYKSGHHFVFLSNIILGTILLICCLVVWLLSDKNNWTVTLFLTAMGNIVVSIYYIVVLGYAKNKMNS